MQVILPRRGCAENHQSAKSEKSLFGKILLFKRNRDFKLYNREF